MAIITYPLNGITYDATDAETYFCTRTSGVFSAENNFTATITGTREITLSEGIAWIRNADFAGKSIVLTESESVTFDAAESLPRIDRIVLRFDGNGNESYITVIKGTAASTPLPPNIQRANGTYDLCLYDVLVRANTTSIAISDVTNKMLDESVCGLMRDGVTRIPTAELQAQATAIIEDVRQALEDIISEGIPPHAFKHEIGGTDYISPSSIGAMSAPTAKTAIDSPVHDNTEYRLTNVGSLSITYPTGNFECWIRLTTRSSGTISISFPSGTQYLGYSPVFERGKTYEISIKDKVVAWAEVA